MKVIFSGDKNNIDVLAGSGITLGNFDGLHTGHVKLIEKTLAICKEYNLKSILYTFKHHPESIINKDIFRYLITPNKLKLKILREYKLDYLYFEEFNYDFMNIKPHDFVKDILVDKFNVKSIVVGFDYRFGYAGEGDIKLLKQLGEKYKFNVCELPPVLVNGDVISSSKIRKLIKAGDIKQSSIFSGREYSILGKVVSGNNIGNKLGFPTINIIPDDNWIIPRNGVYITKTIINNKMFNSITNVGNAPTVEVNQLRIETYILSFNDFIYDSEVEIRFIEKIRDEKKFGNISELTEQITKDVVTAQEYFKDKGIYNKFNLC